jgi:hypothetical protein
MKLAPGLPGVQQLLKCATPFRLVFAGQATMMCSAPALVTKKYILAILLLICCHIIDFIG